MGLTISPSLSSLALSVEGELVFVKGTSLAFVTQYLRDFQGKHLGFHHRDNLFVLNFFVGTRSC